MKETKKKTTSVSWKLIKFVGVLCLVYFGPKVLANIGHDYSLQGFNTFAPTIEIVKQGVPYSPPSSVLNKITYEEAWDSYFADTVWRGFDAEGGEKVVEFAGKAFYKGEEVSVYVQIKVNEIYETFKVNYISANDDKLDKEVAFELLYDAFDEYARNNYGTDLEPEYIENILEGHAK